MSEQLPLMGFDPPPPRNDRLFFALVPPPAPARQIGQLAQQLRSGQGLTGRLIAPERLHITLHHLGDHAGLPTGLIEQARRVAATVTMPSFDVTFDRVLSFARPRNRPMVLTGGGFGNEALDGVRRFQQALGAAMIQGGLGKMAESNFTPHVTMLYDDREVVAHAVEPVTWKVSEFVLTHSLLGLTTHLPLGRWPLLEQPR